MLHLRLNTNTTRRRLAAGLLVAGIAAAAMGRHQEAQAQDPAPPQISLAGLIVSVYQNGNLGPQNAAFTGVISSQDSDGSFRDGNGSITGKITAVRNGLGTVVGHRIEFTRRASDSLTEVFSGAIQSTSYGNFYLAGTYQKRTRVKRGLALTQTTGPLPFHGQAFHIGG